MSGLDKGKAAHVKSQKYLDVIVPVVDQPQSVIYDRVTDDEYFQRRYVIITNGADFIIIFSDVDYTQYLHRNEDCETDPVPSHIPGNAALPMVSHRMARLQDDSEMLKDMLYTPTEYIHNPDIDEEH